MTGAWLASGFSIISRSPWLTSDNTAPRRVHFRPSGDVHTSPSGWLSPRNWRPAATPKSSVPTATNPPLYGTMSVS